MNKTKANQEIVLVVALSASGALYGLKLKQIANHYGSLSLVSIEGKEHSGSLVTARFALSADLEVGAVPGDIFSPTAFGPHQLLRDGAWPVVSHHDILAMVGLAAQAVTVSKASRVCA